MKTIAPAPATLFEQENALQIKEKGKRGRVPSYPIRKVSMQLESDRGLTLSIQAGKITATAHLSATTTAEIVRYYIDAMRESPDTPAEEAEKIEAEIATLEDRVFQPTARLIDGEFSLTGGFGFDAENLAEYGISDFLTGGCHIEGSIAEVFEQFNIPLEITEDFSSEADDAHYNIEWNSVVYKIYTNEEVESNKLWSLTVDRTIAMINDQLERHGIADIELRSAHNFEVVYFAKKTQLLTPEHSAQTGAEKRSGRPNSELNHDAARRDTIIFGHPPSKGYDTQGFDHLTLNQLDQLVKENFIDLSDRQNDSPTAGEFYEFVKTYPRFTLDGYVVSPLRDDYRVTIGAIQLTAPATEEELFAFLALSKDGNKLKSDTNLEAWWN